jgi:hypothetical protein
LKHGFPLESEGVTQKKPNWWVLHRIDGGDLGLVVGGIDCCQSTAHQAFRGFMMSVGGAEIGGDVRSVNLFGKVDPPRLGRGVNDRG